MSTHMRLTRAMRDQIDAIREVLRPWGLQSDLAYDGPHLAVKVHGPRGGVWRLTIASTPRDAANAVGVARQNAKRLVREINSRAGY
jgi:hypothetical protein